MSSRARVTVAYATVKVLDPATGKWTVYGYPGGAVFPENADAENVANLVRRGYAEWVDGEVPEPAPAEAPPAGPVKAEPKPKAKAEG